MARNSTRTPPCPVPKQQEQYISHSSWVTLHTIDETVLRGRAVRRGWPSVTQKTAVGNPPPHVAPSVPTDGPVGRGQYDQGPSFAARGFKAAGPCRKKGRFLPPWRRLRARTAAQCTLDVHRAIEQRQGGQAHSKRTVNGVLGSTERQSKQIHREGKQLEQEEQRGQHRAMPHAMPGAAHGGDRMQTCKNKAAG